MSPTRLEKIEAAMRVALSFNQAFNLRDLAAMMAQIGDGCIFEHSAPAPDGTTCAGKKVIAQFWQDYFQRHPQAHRAIEDAFGFGKRCIMRWRCEWVDAAGQTGHVRGVDIFQVEDGAITGLLSYVKG